MILQIIVPKQQTSIEDIKVNSEIVIIGQVTGFWKYVDEEVDAVLRWSINPNALIFSSFPDNFTNLCLSKYPHKNGFRLSAEYEYTDLDDGELMKEEVVFRVTSVEEVQDFPSVSS